MADYFSTTTQPSRLRLLDWMLCMQDDVRQRVLDATGFSLPDAYLDLLSDGRLRYGDSREDWTANWQTIATTNPPALMCSPWFMSVEWRSIDDLIAWVAPDYWKPNNFVSFAGNGYGDQWIWDPNLANDYGVPVILCRHDENEAEIIAGNFSEFLYRILLEAFAHISFDARDEFEITDDEFMRYLELNVQVVAKHLPTSHVATLADILKKSFSENEDEEYLYLISEEEKKAIVRRDLSPGVGTKFEHMN